MKASVYCIATTEGQADRIVRELQAVGFSNDDISVLFPDKRGTRDFAHEKHTKAPEGAATGAGTGGLARRRARLARRHRRARHSGRRTVHRGRPDHGCAERRGRRRRRSAASPAR